MVGALLGLSQQAPNVAQIRFTDSSSLLADLDDVRTLQSTKTAVQRWLHGIGTLVAQKDPDLLKMVERIEELEAMFSAAPSEDRLAA